MCTISCEAAQLAATPLPTSLFQFVITELSDKNHVCMVTKSCSSPAKCDGALPDATHCESVVHVGMQEDEFMMLPVNNVMKDLTSRNELFVSLSLCFAGSGAIPCSHSHRCWCPCSVRPRTDLRCAVCSGWARNVSSNCAACDGCSGAFTCMKSGQHDVQGGLSKADLR
jgi:hypothetical protein